MREQKNCPAAVRKAKIIKFFLQLHEQLDRKKM
jgi:hypothetical protein